MAFWPLAMPRGRVVRASAPAQAVLFGPDGRRLVVLMSDRAIRTVPLFPGEESRTLFASGVETPALFSMAADPSGRRLAVSGFGGRLVVVGLDGASAETLEGFPPQSLVGRPAFSHDGRLLAAGVNGVRYEDAKTIRVWNLETGTVRAYGPLPGAGPAMKGGIADVAFAGPDRLLAAVRNAGLISLDLASGAARVVVPRPIDQFAARAGRRDGGGACSGMRSSRKQGPARRSGSTSCVEPRRCLEHGDGVIAIALNPGGTVGRDRQRRPHDAGFTRVGRTASPACSALKAPSPRWRSPDSRWLAASGDAFAIRLWPVPDVSKPPPHLLPRDALLTWLRSHTNLKAVPNAASSTGYVLEPGPFPDGPTCRRGDDTFPRGSV